MTIESSSDCLIQVTVEFSNQGLDCQEIEHHHGEDDHSHNPNHLMETAVASASILGALFIGTGNLGTLASCWRCRRLQTIPNMYVCSLALADLLVGLVLLLRGVLGFPATAELVDNDKYFCLCFASLMFTSVAASMFSSSLVACDRYVFIRYPLRYETLITRKGSFVSIIITWCLAVAYGFVPLRWSHFESAEDCAPTHIFPYQYMIIIHPIVFFSLSALTFTLHAKIYKIALKHHSRIHAQSLSVQHSINSFSTTCRSAKENRECSSIVEDIFSSATTPQNYLNNQAPQHERLQQRQVVMTVQEYQPTPQQTLSKQIIQDHCNPIYPQQVSSDLMIRGREMHDQHGQPMQQNQQQNQKQTSRLHNSLQSDQPSLRIKRLSRSSWKLMKAMVLAFGLFFLCWCPLLVVAYMEYTVHVSHTALSIAGLIGVLNSGKNCVVLIAMNRDFRREFKILLCCQCLQSKTSQVPSTMG